MNAVPASETELDIPDKMVAAALGQIDRWIDLCYEFRAWEREHVIAKEPTSEILAKHKKSLSMILKGTRFMLMVASDPDTLDAENYSRLTALHDQLQHSWEMIYHPPGPEQEAKMDALLAKIFPE